MPKKDIKLSNQTQKIMSCINDPCGDASVVVHFPLHEKNNAINCIQFDSFWIILKTQELHKRLLSSFFVGN